MKLLVKAISFSVREEAVILKDGKFSERQGIYISMFTFSEVVTFDEGFPQKPLPTHLLFEPAVYGTCLLFSLWAYPLLHLFLVGGTTVSSHLLSTYNVLGSVVQ